MRATALGRLLRWIRRLFRRLAQPWSRGALARPSRVYGSYGDYIAHQKHKTTDPRRILKWLGPQWAVKVRGFQEVFARNAEFLSGKRNAICLGSRTGQEVKALIDMGIVAIGVDLVPFPPFTVEGDVHALCYPSGAFDFAFTNIFDHALYPDRFCQEMERVVSRGGTILMRLQVGIEPDAYAETVVDDPAAVVAHFSSVKVEASRPIQNGFDGMNWELVLRRC